MGHGRRRGRKAHERQRQSAGIYIEQRQATVAQWVALRPLFEVCARETGYEGGRYGGAKRRQKNNFRPPWQTHGKLKGGGGSVGRWARSRNGTGREDGVGSRHAGTETRDAQVGE